MLTRSSVHWAARIVATRSSSGFEKSRAIVAPGYAFLSARPRFRARARFASGDSRIELSRQGPAATRMASGVISTRPTSSRTGSRLASPSEGSYPRTTQSTSEPGSGTPPTRTRSNATANGRSRDGRRRTRAVTSGPGCAAASTSAPGSNVTDARVKPLSWRRNSLKSAARIVARSSRTRPASTRAGDRAESAGTRRRRRGRWRTRAPPRRPPSRRRSGAPARRPRPCPVRGRPRRRTEPRRRRTGRAGTRAQQRRGRGADRMTSARGSRAGRRVRGRRRRARRARGGWRGPTRADAGRARARRPRPRPPPRRSPRPAPPRVPTPTAHASSPRDDEQGGTERERHTGDEVTLEGEHPLEPSVDRGRGAAEIVARVPPEPLPRARQRDGREEERIEVARVDDGESRALHHAGELTCGVATPVAERDVVAAPEPAIGRHRDHEQAARPQGAAGRDERRHVVVEVLEDVEEEHGVGPTRLHDEVPWEPARPDVEAGGTRRRRKIRMRLHADRQ